MNDVQTIGFRRRHLPHWTVADRSYFVTIRLKGSLPSAVVDDLRLKREALIARHLPPEEMDRSHREEFRRIEAILDAGSTGPKFFDIAPVADIVFKAFEWLEQQKGWTVQALSVMPNHVHAVLRNVQGRNDQLHRDLGILKGTTGRNANRVLDRTGRPFWIDENFDHWCRTDKQLLRAVRYTLMNPVSAQLVPNWHDWPWTRVDKTFLPGVCEAERGVSGKNA